MIGKYLKLIILLAFIFLPAGVAKAHNLKVLAYVDDSKVYTETYFFDGRAVSNGQVQVLDSHKNIVLKGRTNENGLFAFSPPVQDDLTIVVHELMGHNNKYIISKEQLVF